MSSSASTSNPHRPRGRGKWRSLFAPAALCGAGLLLAGCANLDAVAPPVARVLVSRPHSDPAVLAAGRTIYLTKCASCHAPEAVADHAGAWPRIIRDMAPRTKLAPDQEHAVLAYVLAAERAR